MEQTFLRFVLTNIRFWLSSQLAIARSLILPLPAVIVSFGLALGIEAAVAACFAALVWMLVDWLFLVVRMARRIALGVEEPEELLMRGIWANARHLYRQYYADPLPGLRPA